MYRKPQSGVHLCLLAARTLTLRSGTMAAAAVPSLSSAAQWKDISLSMLLRAADLGANPIREGETNNSRISGKRNGAAFEKRRGGGLGTLSCCIIWVIPRKPE